MTRGRKKLIEVALPLDAINEASAREKSIRHGHPSTLHLWWARRPLAAARAVIFAQMVDDPSSCPEIFPTEKAQEKERKRLFKIIEDLVKWENTTNEEVLQRARDEIWQSWRRACADNADHPRAKELFDRNKLPAFHDPFAGGGSLPLEAQRLGLEAYASDLNPVAVLICKAMIEIPPKFAGKPPVNPEAQRQKSQMDRSWRGAQGLAEDVRYYGQWMRDQAEKRIGHLYPKVEITTEMAQDRPDLKPLIGQKLTVIAWLWARTVKSPNPAFANVDVPLASTFMLSTKPGKEAYVEPLIENGNYRFSIRTGKPKDPELTKRGTKSGGSGSPFVCLMSGTPMSFEYLRSEAKAGRMHERLMAVVVEVEKGRIYLPPNNNIENVARTANPTDVPESELPKKALGFRIQEYGMTKWRDLFTPRQLVALTTFSDLVQEAREQIKRDALAAGLNDDGKPLAEGGVGATAYADAVAIYLGLASSRASDAWSTIVSWRNGVEATRGTFARQALPMVWDFAEANPFSDSCGNWIGACLEWVSKAILALPTNESGAATQADAASQHISKNKIVSTDPPYYDNIGYADLSDFFYLWLRRSLRITYPDLFATITVPKAEELVATPYRHGGKDKAEAFFLDGMTQVMHSLTEQDHPGFPITIYYAFKQSETESESGTTNTGWETFLEALIRAGYAISGTWPVRTEREARSISIGTNALASSIILVCRKSCSDMRSISRREFITGLKAELPLALAYLQRSNIAPVDLAQASIGPGMAIFTSYAKVLDAKGAPVSVRDALALINQTLDEIMAAQEGDIDADSRLALAWFEQHGFNEGEFGVAETLSKAKDTSIKGMVEAGILSAKAGKVRLLRPAELASEWDPASDKRLTVWEMVHYLIRALAEGGEKAAAELVRKLGSKAEEARQLAYRLYVICERKKRAQDALSYNSLVQSWPEILRLAREGKEKQEPQGGLFDQE